MFTPLTKKLDSFIELGIPFYDCAVMKDGKCVYRHSSGYTDIIKKTKVTGKEKYYIYSCTKLITCVAALQLWERGLFSLDDKLSDYMPEFSDMTVCKNGECVPAQKPILIHHLFSMTAGFSYDLFSKHLMACRKETNGVCQTRDVMLYLAKEHLLFEPGERFEYSLCHDVLGALIEVISGITFGEYVKKNIFEPIGMNESTFLVSDDRLDEITTQYIYDPENGVCKKDKSIDYRLGSKYESGGAGGISTVDDYIKFIEAIRIGNLILKKETVDMIATNRLPEGEMLTDGYGFGLGQRCPIDATKTDFGWSGAAGAYYAIDRKNNTTVYLATQILKCEPYMRKRGEILPIIQEILK